MSLGHKYTSVSGNWVAPSATGNGTSTTADAAWIGIGGVTTNDLIQVGTTNTVAADGTLASTAFYEMLPDVSQNIPSLVITPGDSITAKVQEQSPGQWLIYISDVTTGKSFSKTVSYTSAYSSAEWIEEDPSYADGSLIPFDYFTPVSFSASSTLADGVVSTLTTAGQYKITLVNSSKQALATPSTLGADGASFTVTRNTP